MAPPEKFGSVRTSSIKIKANLPEHLYRTYSRFYKKIIYGSVKVFIAIRISVSQRRVKSAVLQTQALALISATTHAFKIEDGPNQALNKASGKRNALGFQTPHLLSLIADEEY